jgi:hypothetical protein
MILGRSVTCHDQVFDESSTLRLESFGILPHVVEDTTIDPFNGLLKIGVFKHDAWRFSAKLKSCPLQVALCRSAKNTSTNRITARERDLTDMRMIRKCSACIVSVARNDVHDTFGQPRFRNQLSEIQSGKRSQFCRFQDGCIPCGQAWAQLPSAKQEGKIPLQAISIHLSIYRFSILPVQ